MYYFISYMLFYVLNTQFRVKELSISNFGLVAKDDRFWLGIVTSVTSRERGVLALCRHIRRLFLHAQIGAKAIFTSE